MLLRPEGLKCNLRQFFEGSGLELTTSCFGVIFLLWRFLSFILWQKCFWLLHEPFVVAQPQGILSLVAATTGFFKKLGVLHRVWARIRQVGLQGKEKAQQDMTRLRSRKKVTGNYYLGFVFAQ